jgi:SAM-dependent methyltransferase
LNAEAKETNMLNPAMYGNETETPPVFWERQYENLDDIWIELHRIQTDFCLGSELGCYFRSPNWHSAETVADIGAGSGYYLYRLHSVFPDKQYTGIDINNSFVEHARENYGSASIDFRASDLFSCAGEFDFLIIRLVFQHLSNPANALDKIVGLLKPGGSAFIIDALDQYRFYHPEPKEYMRFFKAFSQHQLSHGMDRDICGKIPTLITQHPKLEIERSIKLTIPSTISNNLSLFEQTYYLVILMLEADGKMKYDYDSVKKAWRKWCDINRRYMQVGLRYIILHRL